MVASFPFNARANGFSIENAYCLAKLSELTYEDEAAKVIATGQSWGFAKDRCVFYNRGDTQAFIFHDDEKILVAFRGTEPTHLEDWMSDAKIRKTAAPGGNVHRGFYGALMLVWHDMEQWLEGARRPEQSLWITGHSLGAALAALATASLLFSEAAPRVNGLYTYGQPRCGSEPWAAAFNMRFKAQAFRVVNNNDVVTRVPPSNLNYSHIGQLKYIDADGRMHSDGDLSWWARFWDRVEGRLADFGHVGPDGIRDHSIATYAPMPT